MHRNQHYHRDKKFLAIHRERRSLRKRRSQSIEIDPPIPRGWVRHWRLTAKALNRHDASILQYILQEIDNPRFHWRRSFVSGKRRQRRMAENLQALGSIREHRWKRLGWPEDWKKYFRQIQVNQGRYDETFTYKMLREDLFELFIERRYVRHIRVLDPEAESREAELKMHLTNHRGNHRLTKLLDTGYRWGPDSVHRKLERLAERRIRKALEGDWEAEVSRSSSSAHFGNSINTAPLQPLHPSFGFSFS